MATFTVNTTSDVVNSGDSLLSLREAVQQANATARADVIQLIRRTYPCATPVHIPCSWRRPAWRRP